MRSGIMILEVGLKDFLLRSKLTERSERKFMTEITHAFPVKVFLSSGIQEAQTRKSGWIIC